MRRLRQSWQSVVRHTLSKSDIRLAGRDRVVPRVMVRASAKACAVAILSALLFTLLAALLSRQARAATTTVAVFAEGPDAAAVRRSVAHALPAGTFIADDMMFRDELARQGQRKPLGVDLDASALARIPAAATGLGIDTVAIAGEPRTKWPRALA